MTCVDICNYDTQTVLAADRPPACADVIDAAVSEPWSSDLQHIGGWSIEDRPTFLLASDGTVSRSSVDEVAPPKPGMKLVFSEEFDELRFFGGADGIWSTTYWWGGRTLPTNAEEQFYVDSSLATDVGEKAELNPFRVDNGIISIRANRAPVELRSRIEGYHYTSGLLTTYKAFQFTFGFVEVRIKVPKGRGLWPAVWLLRKDWAGAGEIDILEVLGDRTSFLNATLHYLNAAGRNAIQPDQRSATLAASGGDLTHEHLVRERVDDLASDFHVVALDWNEQSISIFFDGEELARTSTPPALTAPMYILLNLAVGGKWPGSPDETTAFPADFQIDFVRVWQHPQEAY